MSETIPIAEVQKGINICIKKTREELDTAIYLIAGGRTNQAYTHVVYGLEEMGRAVMFNEKLKDTYTSGKDFIEVERNKLYDHKAKQQAVMSILPENLKNLAMGTFNTQYVNFLAMKEGKPDILQDLRERVTYVDYRNGKWQSSPTIDSNGLTAFIKGVEEEADKFQKYSVTTAPPDEKRE
jgi:AbiV family abortive infection protein